MHGQAKGQTKGQTKGQAKGQDSSTLDFSSAGTGGQKCVCETKGQYKSQCKGLSHFKTRRKRENGKRKTLKLPALIIFKKKVGSRVLDQPSN